MIWCDELDFRFFVFCKNTMHCQGPIIKYIIVISLFLALLLFVIIEISIFMGYSSRHKFWIENFLKNEKVHSPLDAITFFCCCWCLFFNFIKLRAYRFLLFFRFFLIIYFRWSLLWRVYLLMKCYLIFFAGKLAKWKSRYLKKRWLDWFEKRLFVTSMF